MNIQFNATIELKAADVQRIIEEAVKAQMQGYTIKNVEFEAGLAYNQMDRGPSYPIFKGAKVFVEPKRTEF